MDGAKKPGAVRTLDSLIDDGVTFVGGNKAVKIDYQNKQVILSDDSYIPYDKVLLATGCKNRFPPIPGLNDVYHCGLRNIHDYEKINSAIRKDGVKNVTIIGAGFIGMEVASAIKLQFK